MWLFWATRQKKSGENYEELKKEPNIHKITWLSEISIVHFKKIKKMDPTGSPDILLFKATSKVSE